MSIELALAAAVIVALISVMTLAVHLVNVRIKLLEDTVYLLSEEHNVLLERTQNAEMALKALESFELRGPDHDEFLWLMVETSDRKISVNLGKLDEFFLSGLMEFEQNRKAILAKAKGDME